MSPHLTAGHGPFLFWEEHKEAKGCAGGNTGKLRHEEGRNGSRSDLGVMALLQT